MKKVAAWILVGCLLLGLTACSQEESHVFVQKVETLTQMGGIGANDRFGGIVVSESVTEIEKDDDKSIAEVYVRKGDEVSAGQELFSYDTEQIQLSLDKQRIELEQLESSIESYTAQIEQLEKDRERSWSSSDKLKYTLQIQTNQIDLKEAQLNLKTKQTEIQKSEHLLANAVVTSPVDGRITALGDEQTNNYGETKAYITIQQTGSFRVKGTLNEMQMGSIIEGDRIRVESRLDESQFWMGTVSLVDYENPTQGGSNSYYIDSDEMGNSSRYPFYVEMDSIDGMLLGQHVYLSVEQEQTEELTGLLLSASFIAYDEDGNPFAWADNGRGRLEKRNVELGEYDSASDAYQILSGLEEGDYIAFPDESVCTPGAPTTKSE